MNAKSVKFEGDCGFLVFLEQIETTRIFIRDCTTVSVNDRHPFAAVDRRCAITGRHGIFQMILDRKHYDALESVAISFRWPAPVGPATRWDGRHVALLPSIAFPPANDPCLSTQLVPRSAPGRPIRCFSSEGSSRPESSAVLVAARLKSASGTVTGSGSGPQKCVMANALSPLRWDSVCVTTE